MSSYRWVFSLLAFCALAIMLLQGFWIRNFFVQKKEHFTATVYSALEQIIRKLHDRDQLRIVKERGDSLFAYSLRKKVDLRSGGGHTMPLPPAKPGTRANPVVQKLIIADTVLILPSPNSNLKTLRGQEISINRELQIREGMKKKISLSFSVGSSTSSETIPSMRDHAGITDDEISQFMKRLITEVHIIDTDQKNSDSLATLIRQVLAAKGITTDFEFSLRNIRGDKQRVLAQSKHFDPSAPSFSGDLSQYRVLSTHNHLLLQFPGQDGIVFSNMKGSLLLAAGFLAVILSLFYYTARIILRQKKLSDVRNDFVNNMTHELKTPIATIGLALDAINHPVVQSDPHKLREYTGIMKEENSKLNRHVERVLQISLLEKGEVKAEKEKISLKKVIEDAVAGFRLQVESQGANILVSLAEEDLYLNGDRQHLTAMVSNLIDNALKYSGNGCTVRIHGTREQEYLVLKISDDGPGIPRHEREKIFEKFYRIPTMALHDVKGFGVGLSYVKTVVDMHGGSISVSDSDKGATFFIRLKAI